MITESLSVIEDQAFPLSGIRFFWPVVSTLAGFVVGAILAYIFDLKKLKMRRRQEFDLQQVNSLLDLLKRLLIVTRGELPAEKWITGEILDQLYAEAIVVVSLPHSIKTKLEELYSKCLAYNAYLDSVAKSVVEIPSDSVSVEGAILKVSDKGEEQKRHELEGLVRAIIAEIRQFYVTP